MLAWRNLGRNPRRTWLTMLVIALATCLSIFLRAQQIATHKQLIINTLGVYAGEAQIRAKNDSIFQFDVKMMAQMSQSVFSPRLEMAHTLKSVHKWKLAQVVGIIPKQEQAFSRLEQRLIQGSYFQNQSEKALILSEKLAQSLKVKAGDKIQLIDNQLVIDLWVLGIVRLPNPELNQTLAYLPLATLQKICKKTNKINVIALQSGDYKNIPLAKELEIRVWQTFAPDLAQMLQMDSMAENLLLSLFYLLMLFGIFSTVMMSVMERKYELAVLLGLGMRRRQLTRLILLEISLLTGIGILLGLLPLIPLLIYLQNHPLELQGVMAESLKKIGLLPRLYYELSFEVLSLPIVIIFAWAGLAFIYPIQFIQKIKIIESLKA
jgi:ABC-type lipoprotein release transport system permease subunit